MSDADWRPLMAALDRFGAAGRHVRFWLRDDDAIAPTPALDRLIDLCERYAAPLLLAVIPEPATEALALRLAETPLIQPCQHGFTHANHAPEGVRKREFGPDRPLAVMLAELSRGQERLQTLLGRSLRPVLVPPWNRIDAGLLPHLPALGFRALSTIGRRAVGNGMPIPEINTNLDIMNWREGRAGFDHATLIEKLVGELEIAFGGAAAVGILTHHRVHDETAWSFLETLLTVTSGHPAMRWISVDALI